MTPYFFPPFHCCLSEKEIQLKCLFDGEIDSVVFIHLSFFVSLRLWLFCPPPSSIFLVFLLLFVFLFGAKMLEESSVTVCFLFDFCPPKYPCITSRHKDHQNHFMFSRAHTYKCSHTLTHVHFLFLFRHLTHLPLDKLRHSG